MEVQSKPLPWNESCRAGKPQHTRDLGSPLIQPLRAVLRASPSRLVQRSRDSDSDSESARPGASAKGASYFERRADPHSSRGTRPCARVVSGSRESKGKKKNFLQTNMVKLEKRQARKRKGKRDNENLRDYGFEWNGRLGRTFLQRELQIGDFSFLVFVLSIRGKKGGGPTTEAERTHQHVESTAFRCLGPFGRVASP